MTSAFIKRIILFFVFILAQAMVLRRIHLFGFATPLLYVYFVTMFPRNYPKWGILVWSFAMGLLIDIFTNTPGMAAASLTLIAAIQPYFFEIFVPRDSVEDLKPSLANLGALRYTYYVTTLVLLYSIVFFSLEMFSFFHMTTWLMSVAGSTLLTLLLIFTFEIAKGKK